MSDDAPHRRIGPYRLLELLGRGGMGIVYRAEHEQTGEVVALKTVRAPRERQLGSLRREIAALSRIRHPGVVRIVAEGVDGGVPWYAMEMIHGTTLLRFVRSGASDSSPTLSLTSGELRAAAATEHAPARPIGLGDAEASAGRWWTHSLPSPLGSTAVSPRLPEPAPSEPPTRRGSEAPPPPPERRRSISPSTVARIARLASRLCRALAFLHGEGIVHRDLKPENVIVRPDGVPVLVDFGLMARVVGSGSREAVAEAPSAVGTVSYIAPEQLRGDFVDARADLYSLGCILYELVVGRPPFEGATLEAVAAAHLSAAPLPPSARVDDVPLSLERVILRLLAKTPGERLGYAEDVAAQLAQLAAEPEPESEEPRARPYLYRPRLAGRDALLDALGERVGRMRAGEGGVALWSGPTGIGKTRLLMETARDAERAGVLVLAGAATPAASGQDARESGEPLGALRRPLELVADRCRAAGEEQTRRWLGPRGGLLAAYEPSLHALPGLAELGPLARLPPEARRRGLLAAISELWLALAAESPLLLVLDDLEWADELTLGWLAGAAADPRLRAARVLVLGSYRSDEGARELAALAQVPGVERVSLEPLDEAAVGSMLMDMLALDAPADTFTRFLAHHSEGNAFFVAEYLHAAVGEGLLGRDVTGRWRLAAGDDVEQALALDSLPLPRSLRELVRRRLDALAPDARRLAEIASAFGRETDVRCLGDVSAFDASRLLDAVSELVTRQVMSDVSPGRIGFSHDKIRELAYEAVPRARRPSLHRAAARALARLEPTAMAQLASVARQHLLGGEPREAARWHLAAAGAAERVGALPEALEQYTAARRATQDLPDGAPERLRARLGRGGLLATTGHVDDATRDLEEAATLARTAGDGDAEAQARVHLSFLGHLRGDAEATHAQAELAAQIGMGSSDLGLRAQIENALGVACSARGDLRSALSHYQRAADLARRLGDRAAVGRYLANLAERERLVGDLEAARRTALAAVDEVRAGRERALECQALCHLGRVELDRGDLDAAAAAFEGALHLGGELDIRHALGEARCGLARVALARGQLETAEEHGAIALDVAEELGHAVSAGTALRVLAEIALADGPEQRPRARELVERSVAVLRTTAEHDELAESLLALGRQRVADRDAAGAQSTLGEAVSLFARLGMQRRMAAAREALRDAEARARAEGDA